MSLRSAIPHLARAIAEKRSSQIWNVNRSQRFASRMRIPSLETAKKRPVNIPQEPHGTHGDSKRNKDWAAQMMTIEDPDKARRVSVLFKATAGFAFVVGLYCLYLYQTWSNSVVKHANSGDYLPFNADVSSRWKELGRDFDDEVELSEKLMNMRMKRKRLADRAYGNVLEVSVGTGRNLRYYNLKGFDPLKPGRRNIITHLTLNDQSGVIIAAAEAKVEKIMSQTEKSKVPTAQVDFVVGDAGLSGIIERPEGGYDTIVQTMGVCSMVDPVGFLKRMGKLCRQPGEKSQTPERWRAKDDDGKGGQILLLEHGKGYFDWLNWILDTGASLHAHRFGCWWNKDVEQIVKQSGLEVERIKRYHGGTTWLIILRPAAQHKSDAKETETQSEGLRVTSARQFNFFGQK